MNFFLCESARQDDHADQQNLVGAKILARKNDRQIIKHRTIEPEPHTKDERVHANIDGLARQGQAISEQSRQKSFHLSVSLAHQQKYLRSLRVNALDNDSVASLPKHGSISPQRRGGRGENLEKTLRPLRLGGELTKRR